MELRQLRYFVTLTEELHFGRAAEREHIVQSALSQQLQRLERELDIRLLERSTHHVELTSAGQALLIEARQILAHVDRAAASARSAAELPPRLRIGIIDGSYDSMPLVLREVRRLQPDTEVHQIEATMPEQYAQLISGRLDVGFGQASLAPPEVASELFRLDPLGVLVPRSHPFSALPAVRTAMLAGEPLLLAGEQRAPEFNQHVLELCRSTGFLPEVYPGTVQSIQGAISLVEQGLCVLCVPSSCRSAAMPQTVWKPLVEPASCYRWSVLWRAADNSDQVCAVVRCARTLSRQHDWLASMSIPEHGPAEAGLPAVRPTHGPLL